MAKVLIADDERAICDVFRQVLAREGHTALVACNGEEAIDLAEKEQPDVIFLDVQMPVLNGLDALGTLRERCPSVPVIVMTAYGTVDTAMRAMRLGAFDYLGKPVELPRIRALLVKALHKPQEAGSRGEPPAVAPVAGKTGQLVGNSAAMQEIFKLMGLLTGNDLTVLISGESGTGKELVARGLHEHGPRKNHPFVAVNCAAIPEQLIESELFGHEKGAFTGAGERRVGRFEAAAQGTIFLDEISELPYHLQSKLLRVLQEKSFERVGCVTPVPLQARIIAATNRPLDNTGDEHPFRQDLYHRLSLVNLTIPPLRERGEDIEALARHFLALANKELGKSIRDIEPEALARLRSYQWPGNVRELEHTLKRSVLVTRGDLLTIHDLVFETTSIADGPQESDGIDALREAARRTLAELAAQRGEDDESSDLFQQLTEATERALIEQALNITGNNQVAASKLLGLNRGSLRKKMP